MVEHDAHVARTLGFVGLGAMGGGIARRLLDAGHTVHGYNRTREKAVPLLEAGLALAESPREVAERAEIVFSMVTNVAALAAVTEGPDGILAGLSPGKLYVEMSTVTPEASRAPNSSGTRVRSRAGRADGRRAGLGQHRDPGAGAPVGDGRRAGGRVCPPRAGPARHRADGAPDRRQRPGARDEDRDQPQLARADGGVL